MSNGLTFSGKHKGQEMVGTMKSWLAEIFVKLMSTEVLGEDTF